MADPNSWISSLPVAPDLPWKFIGPVVVDEPTDGPHGDPGGPIGGPDIGGNYGGDSPPRKEGPETYPGGGCAGWGHTGGGDTGGDDDWDPDGFNKAICEACIERTGDPCSPECIKDCKDYFDCDTGDSGDIEDDEDDGGDGSGLGDWGW